MRDDDTASQMDFLKLIDQIASLQSSSVDDSEHGNGDLISDAISSVKNFMVRLFAQQLSRLSDQALQQATHFLTNNRKGIANGAGRFNREDLREAGQFLQNNGRGIAQAMGRLTGLALTTGGRDRTYAASVQAENKDKKKQVTAPTKEKDPKKKEEKGGIVKTLMDLVPV